MSSMPAKGFKWNELGKLADSFYIKYKSKSITSLRKELSKKDASLFGIRAALLLQAKILNSLSQ